MSFKFLKIISVSAVVLAISGMTDVKAETLILKNGDRISGNIISGQDGKNLLFKSRYGAELNIPFEQVLGLQDETGKIYTLKTQTQVSSNNYIPDTDPPASEQLAAAQMEPAAGDEEPNDPKEYKWTGRVNLGASLDDGNSQKKAFAGDAEVKARNDKNRWIMGGDANFANDEGEETKNDQSLYGEYNRFLSDKLFIGARQEFEIDKITDLDLRSRTGAFVGYQFYEQDDLNLKVRFGPNYIHEEYGSGDSEDNIAAAWALDYDQTFLDGTFTLFHNHELDVPVDLIDAFIFQSKSGVRVPVGKYLTGTAQVDFDWDNDPAPGVSEQDTSYSIKLGYEW